MSRSYPAGGVQIYSYTSTPGVPGTWTTLPPGSVDSNGLLVNQSAGDYPYVADDDVSSWIAPTVWYALGHDLTPGPNGMCSLTWTFPPAPATWDFVTFGFTSRYVGPEAAGVAQLVPSDLVLGWKRKFYGPIGTLTTNRATTTPTEWSTSTSGQIPRRGMSASDLAAVEDGSMPYYIQSNLGLGNVDVPITYGWQIASAWADFGTLKPPATPPLRWRQRSDGLGAGAPRTRQVSTIQASLRTRGIV